MYAGVSVSEQVSGRGFLVVILNWKFLFSTDVVHFTYLSVWYFLVLFIN